MRIGSKLVIRVGTGHVLVPFTTGHVIGILLNYSGRSPLFISCMSKTTPVLALGWHGLTPTILSFKLYHRNQRNQQLEGAGGLQWWTPPHVLAAVRVKCERVTRGSVLHVGLMWSARPACGVGAGTRSTGDVTLRVENDGPSTLVDVAPAADRGALSADRCDASMDMTGAARGAT